MPPSDSAALPIAHHGLRFLIVLNWLQGVAILVLLVAMPTEKWIMTALKLTASAETDRIIAGLHAIALLGVLATPINHVVLARLREIVATVRSGEPFATVNASRLQVTAWALLTLQVLSLVIGRIAEAVSTPAHPLNLSAGFSIAGWLAVLLVFVLARVFAAGARMRADLEGTV